MWMTDAVGSDWLTVAEAAMACRVSERTMRRWVNRGVVSSRITRHGQRQSRLVLRESLPGGAGDEPLTRGQGTPFDGPGFALSIEAGDSSERGSRSTTETAIVSFRAQVAEEKLEMLAAERERMIGDLEHLCNQLDRRAEEIDRHAQAEADLRRLLAGSQETVHTLASQLAVKALPPVTFTPAPKKARWWKLWNR
jgi:hypothetical protein